MSYSMQGNWLLENFLQLSAHPKSAEVQILLPHPDARLSKEDSYSIFLMESSQAEMSSPQRSIGCEIPE